MGFDLRMQIRQSGVELRDASAPAALPRAIPVRSVRAESAKSRQDGLVGVQYAAQRPNPAIAISARMVAACERVNRRQGRFALAALIRRTAHDPESGRAEDS